MSMKDVDQESSGETTDQPAAPDQPVAEQGQQVEQTPAPEPATDPDADLLAGFNSVNGIEQPEPETAPEPEAPAQASYTPEQIKELMETVEAMKQRESKIFGSMGSLKQTLDALRAQPTPAAPAMKLNPDSFKRLSAEFPEIAKNLLEDLSEINLAGGQADPAQFEQIVEARVKTSLEQASQAFEAKLLTIQHRDWKQVVSGAEFIGWKESLPPDEKAQLDASWEADYIGEKISQFKEWKAKAAQTKQSNQRRLEAAITPRGGGNAAKPALTEADAFVAGFKAVRG